MIEETSYTRLRSRLFDCELPSPLVLASGPRSYNAASLIEAYKSGAGAVVTKTIRSKLPVNPTPHIIKPSSKGSQNTLYNAEEWSDISWEQWVYEEIPALEGHPGALIVSVGHTAQDIEKFIEPLAACETVDMIECVSYSGDSIIPLIMSVRSKTDLPILAKLSFNWGGELFSTAEAALNAGCDGFTAIDSVGPALYIDIETGCPVLASEGGRGWISGAAIKPLALSIVADLKKRFGKPVVGTGGVFSAEDIIEMTMAGADAVGVCSAPILYGNEWFSKTLNKLDRWLTKFDYDSLVEIIGYALPNLPSNQISSGLEFNFDPLLCTLCQMCVVVCPYNARQISGDTPRDGNIQMSLSREICRSCGLCSSVCKPGSLTSKIKQ
ncbi:MAG: 4Fe-4S dicluster domain-containing protein [Anaerolineales bacterium]|nr:4Fe-4S dicluster domain-containing protein [Anaerolineales bacterium]